MQHISASISSTAPNLSFDTRGYRHLIMLIMGMIFILSSSHSQASDHPSAESGMNGTTIKTIIVDNYQPYTFKNEKGMADGFAVDIAKAVAKAMGVTLEIRIDTWPNSKKELENGGVELLPMMAISPERDKFYDFSVPYITAYDAIFFKKNTPGFRSLKELSGKTVLVPNKDAAHDYLVASGWAKTMQINPVESLPEALRQLEAGQGDAAIMPKLVGIMTAKRLDISDLEQSPPLDGYSRPFSFAVNEGNQLMVDRLNQGLNIIKTTGEYKKIYQLWFGGLEEEKIDWLVIEEIGMAVFALLVVIVIWNIMLKRQVKTKTEHLNKEIRQRELNEAALQKSEQRFRTIFDSVNDAIFIHELSTGAILDVNQRMCDMYGCTHEQALGLTIEDLSAGTAPFNQEGALKFLHKAVGGEPQLFDWLAKDKSGRLFWVDVNMRRAIIDEQERLLVTVRDVNQRKQAEEELRFQSEILTNMAEAVYLVRMADGVIVYTNRVFENMFGYKQDEMLGKHVSIVNAPTVNDPEATAKEIMAALDEKGSWQGEVNNIKKDGTPFWCHANVSVFDHSKFGRVLVSVHTDISKRKEREAELQESEEKYRLLVENLSAGVVVHAPDTAIIFSNPMASTLLGLSIDQMQGKEATDPAWCFIRENGTPLPLEEYPVSRVLASGEPMINQVLGIRRPDLAEPLWVQCNSFAFINAAGGLKQIVVTFTDISERKRDKEIIEKRLVALTQPLESGSITFEDLFDIEDVQHLQDSFARATGVASIITSPDGTPLTAPSNFTRLCKDIIRKTEKGCASCYKSDAILGHYNPEGPTIQTCLSGGLWDAGAGIAVGGRHIANWLIGQVRDETQSDDKMAAYAREIGVDEAEFMDAFHELPSMSHRHFSQIAQALFILANQLALTAFQNIQQARFINERRQAEEELKRMTQRLQLATSASGLGVWDWNVRENTMVWDDRMLEIYGVTRETFSKSLDTWSNALHPEDKDRAIAECQAALEGKKTYDTTFRICCPEGTVKFIKANALVIPDTSGMAGRMIGINADISAAKEAEKAKNALEVRLNQAQKMEAIGVLAGGIAHDFNNILGAIMGYAEMARDDAPPGSQLVEDIDKVLTASHRAKDLVKQILAFSRQSAVDRIPIIIQPLVKESLKMLRASIPSTISITEDIHSQSGTVLADPTQIHQIVMNLCTNAYHAMEKTGGELAVTVKPATISSPAPLDARQLTPGEYVELTVSDTGTGIGPDIIDKIFDPYFTTKGVGKGSGMGLSITHGIIQSYGGAITVDSTLGQGTTFHVYIPVVEAEAKEAEDATEVPKGKGRILFIDDEEMLLEMGHSMLERLGYTVTSRHSSFEALETFMNDPHRFDLVITDQTMPGMTGADLSRRMLQIRPDVPIILCTGYSNLINVESAKAIGIREFAFKPLTKSSIGHLVDKILTVSHNAALPRAKARR